MSSEQPPRLQVFEQARDRLVHAGAADRQLGREPRVVVPVGLGVELDEPHAALHQPAGDQTLPAEPLGMRLVQAIEPASRLGLAADIEGLGRLHLHPERQLKRLDPRSSGCRRPDRDDGAR